jgi:mRNA interferase RelE/StbE
LNDDWRVEFSRAAMRDLRRLDRPVRVRILDALERLATDPAGVDVRRLSGRSGEWRLRVGDWRVRFLRDAPERVILVTRVLPRGRAYDR